MSRSEEDERGSDNATEYSVAIVGSGFGGICMGVHLLRAGIRDFVILEKGDGPGGTWRVNTYPGAGCDVPSFLYSFSFEPKLDWSRKFAEQPEILAYLEHCVSKYGLEPHVRYRTEVVSAEYDEAASRWRLTSADGRTFLARTFVGACGQLERPYTPAIEGLGTFEGAQFHSARWRHDFDLTGKRVAVIGNGASALQFIPRIAPEVGKLFVVQRSPNWIVPKPDRAFTPRELDFFQRNPWAARLYRWWIYLAHESRWPFFSHEGIATRWLARRTARDIAAKLRDPKLREALTPDYPMGCKRLLLSDDYYDAMIRENVEVVTDPIARVERDAVVVGSGRRLEVDGIVFATGFQTTDFLPMRLTGRGGTTLADAWKDGAEAYLGMTVAGFPNFFMLYGPNTNLGHNSIVFMIECQVGYAMQCVREMRRRGARSIDVLPSSMASFNRELQASLRRTVWAGGCSSWYKTDGGRITNNWGHGTASYWWRTRRPDWSAFRMEKA